MSLLRRSPTNIPIKMSPNTFPVQNLQSQLNSFFNSFWNDMDMPLLPEMRTTEFSPAIDYHETDAGYIIETELAGVDKKDVDISLYDNILTIKGEKKHEEEQNKNDMYRLERTYGSFCRTIPFPQKINPDTVKAMFKNGVLKITLDKSTENLDKQKKISIQ